MSVIASKAGMHWRDPRVRFVLPAQPIDATRALNLSAGVSNFKALRGLSLS
jgi:hypothetical protein